MPALFTRNPLAYPVGVAPGFDPTHPAADGMRNGYGGSFVPNGANFINLLNGAKGTVGGAPTLVTAAPYGRSVKMASTTAGVSFSGQKNLAPSGVTFAVIGQFTSIPNTVDQPLISLGSSGQTTFGYLPVVNASQPLSISLSSYTVANGANFTPSVGVPYFIAGTTDGSATATHTQFVMVRLDTGQTKTSPGTTQNGSLTASASVLLGAAQSNNPTFQMAAAMWSPVCLPAAVLAQWAADPWSFWYPNGDLNDLVPMTIGGIFTSFGQTVSIACSSSVSVSKAVAKSAALTCSSAVTKSMAVAKSIANSCASAVSVTYKLTFAKTIALASTTSVTLSKNVGKSVALICSSGISMVRAVAKSIALTCSSSISVLKAIPHTVVLACSTSVSVGKGVGKSVALACASAVATPTRAVGKSVALTCHSAILLGNAVTHSIALACHSAVSVGKGAARSISLACQSRVQAALSLVAVIFITCRAAVSGSFVARVTADVWTVIKSPSSLWTPKS